MSNHGLIRLKRFFFSNTQERLGLKDSSHMKQLNCVISYFSTAFNAPCMCPKIRCDGYCRNFMGNKQGPSHLWLHFTVKSFEDTLSKRKSCKYYITSFQEFISTCNGQAMTENIHAWQYGNNMWQRVTIYLYAPYTSISTRMCSVTLSELDIQLIQTRDGMEQHKSKIWLKKR